MSPLQPRHNYVYDLSRIPIDSTAQAAFWAALGAGVDTTNPIQFCRQFWGFQFTPVVLTNSQVVARLADVMCIDSSWTFNRRQAVTRALFSSFDERWDWRPTLARIRASTLVIQGAAPNVSEADVRRDAVLRHGAETWAASMPAARFMTLPGPALFPWLGHEHGLVRSVETFLDGQWPDEARRIPIPPTPS